MDGDPNPYEPPRAEPVAPADFSDAGPSKVELQRRIEVLEQRVGKSWFVSPSIPKRILATWGYLALGYFLLAMIVWSILGLMFLLDASFGLRWF